MNLAERWKVTPGQVWEMPVDQVMLGKHYAKFISEYDETAMELNKPKQP